MCSHRPGSACGRRDRWRCGGGIGSNGDRDGGGFPESSGGSRDGGRLDGDRFAEMDLGAEEEKGGTRGGGDGEGGGDGVGGNGGGRRESLPELGEHQSLASQHHYSLFATAKAALQRQKQMFIAE